MIVKLRKIEVADFCSIALRNSKVLEANKPTRFPTLRNVSVAPLINWPIFGRRRQKAKNGSLMGLKLL